MDGGAAVDLVVDDVSREIVKIDGYGVFATGSLAEGGAFKVSTWFMDRRNE